MQRGYLSEHFTGVGSKTLTRVDATIRSNQHEVGDSDQGRTLKRILGDQPRKTPNRFIAKYIWLLDEQESITEDGYLTWYDTRENQPHRSAEWRLYYQTNAVTELMSEGDRLFVARQNDDSILFIVVPTDSSVHSKVSWLFGMPVSEGGAFQAHEIADGTDSKLDFVSRLILDEIGIEFEDPNANNLESIIEQYGKTFPTTVEFSDRARLTLPTVDAREDPDAALFAWLNHEEAMFRCLEKKIVAERILSGFHDGGDVDVDGFLKFSLSVQNRRKSRMGRSLENHLAAAFSACDLKFDPQVKTEKGKKPDFVFPGAAEYNDPLFDTGLLTMLAAKSSCKDRWPQILPEAERIIQKHLVTLEPGISVAQTDLMKNSNVQLIVPSAFHISYTGDQRSWLWTLGDFVSMVSERQNERCD